MNGQDIAVFTGSAHPIFADLTVRHLGLTLGNCSVGQFVDGTSDVRIDQDVRGLDVYVVQLDGPLPIWFDENVELIGSAKRSAGRVTLINPYFSKGRGDRRDEPGKSVPAAIAARRLAKTNVDRVALFDLHAPQIAGMIEAAGIDHVDDLYFRSVILDRLSREDLSNTIITPPDFGRLKIVRSYWKRLRQMGYPVELGAIDKDGTSSSGIDHFTVFGDFEGRHVHMFDDILTTGSTIIGATRAALDKGALDVSVWISHMVLPSINTTALRLDTCRALIASPIKKLYCSDSLPLGKDELEIFGDKLEIVTITKLLALVIKRLHSPRSGHRLSSLFELDGYRAALSELTTTG